MVYGRYDQAEASVCFGVSARADGLRGYESKKRSAKMFVTSVEIALFSIAGLTTFRKRKKEIMGLSLGKCSISSPLEQLLRL